MCHAERVRSQPGLTEAAQLFKVLGSEPRLILLQLLADEPRTVSTLVEASGMSQPLVSQHLRTLRRTNLVVARRHGKEVVYQVADLHVTHVIQDAVAHVLEPGPAPQE